MTYNQGFRVAASALAMSMASIGSTAAAERAEDVANVRMFSHDSCPLSQFKQEDASAGTQEFLGAVMAGLLSGLVGNLVQSGLNAAGDALEQASKEKAIGIEGTASFNAYAVSLPDAKVRTARLGGRPQCLILYSADEGPDMRPISEIPGALGGIRLDQYAAFENGMLRTAEDNLLRRNGVTAIPRIYVEAAVIPGDEGLRIEPRLVWYRKAPKGAPTKKAAAELHLSLAVPGLPADNNQIGTIFAGTRVQLPPVQPGGVLDRLALANRRSVYLPLRPTAGYVADQLAATNATFAALTTAKSEKKKADRTLEAAQRKLAAKPGDADAKEAVTVATVTAEDAKEAETLAQKSVDDLKAQADMLKAGLGATNVKMRFVVIRAPNAFGLALAKALKSQAETTGTAVAKGLGDELKAKPDWVADDTAYVTALNEVATKQRAYDDAVAKGDAAAMAAAAGDLTIAKAKLNQAAATINRPIPYPHLF